MNTKLATIAVLLLAGSSLGETIYVSGTGSATNLGASWKDALPTIRAGLDRARPGDSIWVSAGVYGPIELKDGVRIFGGFEGSETVVADAKPEANATVVSGNRKGRAIVGKNCGAGTLVRGLTITGGVIAGTYAEAGGGLLLENSHASFVNCVFTRNASDYMGGAVANYGGGRPVFINCRFLDNGILPDGATVLGGGAAFNHDGEMTFVNCLFARNRAWEGGGIANVAESAMRFTNCTFTANKASRGAGGAIFDAFASTVLRNCIIWGNVGAAEEASEIHNREDMGRRSDVANSLVRGGWPGTANLDADPLFVDPSTGDFRLQSLSPCVSRGSVAFLPADTVDLDGDGDKVELLPLDLNAQVRVEGTSLDMGAFQKRSP